MMAKKTARRRPAPVVTQRRGPSLALIIGAVVVLLFAGIVAFGIYRTQQQNQALNAPPAGVIADGLVVGQPQASTTIDVYLDFQCPACRNFEKNAGPTIDELVAKGTARVIYHPVAYLDDMSGGTRYSSRASAASGCAAKDNVFPQFAKLLYDNQPSEGGKGLPDQQLLAYGQQAGASPAFAECVNTKVYERWTRKVTEEASKKGFNSTPTVLVNGKKITNTDSALRQAVGIQ
ncbi:thioredoxin domain-containing protein [Pseudonocardia eucalypti]|uniref:Thioredoxin domain-containing protein n=2 Tax=Pseudonocardia eucalypti TaxID=648755 RepID=A0ABP9QDF1_9PSEU